MHPILHWFTSLPPALTVFLGSMLPVVELRGTIPYGLLATSLPPWLVIALAFAGCWLSGLIIFALMPALVSLLRHVPWFDRLWTRFSEHSRRKLEAAVERRGAWGVVVFIGLPLPGTGVYTGAVGSYLLGMHWRTFLWVSAAGVALMAAIVSTATLSGSSAFHWIVDTKLIQH